MYLVAWNKPRERKEDMETKQYSKDFTESLAEQGTAEWFKARSGVPTASRLSDFMSFSKRGGGANKARTDYLAELAYERVFGTVIEKFKTKAMDDGIFFEDLVAQLYAEKTGNTVATCGAWVSDYFAASPDRIVATPEDKNGLVDTGLLEIKVMGDKSYLGVLSDGVPEDYYLQIQGQLLATGYDWCDFVAMNLKTKTFKVIRVERNEEKIEELYTRLTEKYAMPAIVGDVQEFEEERIEEYYKTKNATDEEIEQYGEIWF